MLFVSFIYKSLHAVAALPACAGSSHLQIRTGTDWVTENDLTRQAGRGGGEPPPLSSTLVSVVFHFGLALFGRQHLP